MRKVCAGEEKPLCLYITGHKLRPLKHLFAPAPPHQPSSAWAKINTGPRWRVKKESKWNKWPLIFISFNPPSQLTPALPFSLSALANGYLPWWKGYSILKEEKINSPCERKKERENEGVDRRGGGERKKSRKIFHLDPFSSPATQIPFLWLQ